jgi:hypothetical protein
MCKNGERLFCLFHITQSCWIIPNCWWSHPHFGCLAHVKPPCLIKKSPIVWCFIPPWFLMFSCRKFQSIHWVKSC